MKFHIKLYEDYIDTDYKVEITDELLNSAFRGDTQRIREILSYSFVDPNISHDEDGWTPLMVATGIGKLLSVKELLNSPKTDVNVKNNEGWTALMIAVNPSDVDIVSEEMTDKIIEVLLKHPNIDLSIQNNDEETAWDIASEETCEKFPQLNPNFNKTKTMRSLVRGFWR